MEIIKINKIKLLSEPEVVEGIATAYQRAFGYEPNSKVSYCPICKTTIAYNEIGSFCKSCCTPSLSRRVAFVTMNSYDKVIFDCYRLVERKNPICIVAIEHRHVVGFAWGYTISAHDDDDYFYFDKCGVIPDYRGKGLGWELIQKILDRHRHKKVLLCVKISSEMYSHIRHMGGIIIQYLPQDKAIMQLLL